MYVLIFLVQKINNFKYALSTLHTELIQIIGDFKHADNTEKKQS